MKRLVLTFGAALLCSGFLFASSPSVTVIAPPGAQRGHEHTITFSGTRLNDALEVMFYEPGISASEVKPHENGKSFTAKVTIAPDCRIGQIPFRARTKTGISELRLFSVGALPALAEAEPNGTFLEAQVIGINVTIEGKTANEDVDYFSFTAKKGQRISAEVEATRLARVSFYDPRIAILDSKKFELAASDDTPLLAQDSSLSVLIPEDGTYFLSMRDSAYLGGNAPYRLHIGTFPRPTAIFPLGGKPGETIRVKTLGMVTNAFEQDVVITELCNQFMPVTVTQNGEFSPSPNLIRVTPHRNVIETNDTVKGTPTVGGEVPVAFNGVIAEPGQYDWFSFVGKKGKKYHVRSMARTLRTPVDTVLAVYKASGGGALKSNDDTGGPDSYFLFDCPEDGEYVLYVKDHLGMSGPDYAYRVEIDEVKPTLTVNLPIFTRRTQENQAIAVPQGNRFGLRLDAKRDAFGGELKVLAKNLPAGVSLWCPEMASNVSQVPVIFEAQTNAPLAGSFASLHASHIDETKKISGGYFQNSELLYGQNNDVWIDHQTERLPVVVTEPSPFKLELVQPKAPLVHGGTMYLKVKATKKEGWDETIKIKLVYLPPGIGASSEVTLSKGKTEAAYRVNANGSTGDKEWPIAVIGYAEVNGKLWVASNPIQLRTTTPFVNGSIEMAAVEQAQATELVLKLSQEKPFEGEAKATLVGTPNEVSSETLTFTKDTTELVFPITTTEKTPVGHHKTLFASLSIPEAGEIMSSSIAGGGQLRVDPPPKKPAPKPAAVAAAAPAKPAEKRLSRLEKLRLAKEEAK